MQPASNERQVGDHIVILLPHQKAGNRRIVVNDQPAFTIEDLAPWRQNRHFADAVGLRQRVIVLPANHLKPPQPKNENSENGRNDVLDDSKAESGQFFFAVQH